MIVLNTTRTVMTTPNETKRKMPSERGTVTPSADLAKMY